MTSVVGGNSGEQLSSSYSPSLKYKNIYIACQYALIYLLLLRILVYSWDKISNSTSNAISLYKFAPLLMLSMVNLHGLVAHLLKL